MSKKRRKLPLGNVVGRTSKQNLPDPIEDMERTIQLTQWAEQGKIELGTRAYRMGECSIIVSHSSAGWHISIAHPARYPSWDEIAHARYRLVPNDVCMALLLPPQEEYVNLHSNCFQMWECVDHRVGGRPVALKHPLPTMVPMR